MRGLISFLLITLLLGPAGCRRKHHPNPAATIEEPGELESSIRVADPAAESQILYGFYPVERQSWRWTMRRFAVSLRPPAGAAVEGARLELKFTVPAAIQSRIKDLKLSANVGGAQLPAFAIEGEGEQQYLVPVPPRVLEGDAVTVEFELNRAVAPGEIDSRELGVVVTSVGFVEP